MQQTEKYTHSHNGLSDFVKLVRNEITQGEFAKGRGMTSTDASRNWRKIVFEESGKMAEKNEALAEQLHAAKAELQQERNLLKQHETALQQIEMMLQRYETGMQRHETALQQPATEVKPTETPLQQRFEKMKRLIADMQQTCNTAREYETELKQAWEERDKASNELKRITPQLKRLEIDVKRYKTPIKETVAKAKDWLSENVSLLALPMLGLAASYGVYHFASHFTNKTFALIEACGFELVYIGLATLKGLTEKQRRVAVLISMFAVAVSVVYNSFSAYFNLNPEVIKGLTENWKITLSIIHGLPLALVAFFVANFLLHRGGAKNEL